MHENKQKNKFLVLTIKPWLILWKTEYLICHYILFYCRNINIHIWILISNYLCVTFAPFDFKFPQGFMTGVCVFESEGEPDWTEAGDLAWSLRRPASRTNLDRAAKLILRTSCWPLVAIQKRNHLGRAVRQGKRESSKINHLKR